MSNYLRLKKMLYTVALSTIAIVLGIIEMPMILPGLKLDLSEVIILIAILVLGYKSAIHVVIIRALGRRLYYLVMPAIIPSIVYEDPIMGMIGESIAIIASLIIIVSYLFISKALKIHRKPLIEVVDIEPKKVNLLQFILVTLTITLALSVVLVTFNFFIGAPLYFSYYASKYLGFMESTHFTVFGFINDPGIMQTLEAFKEAWYLENIPFEPNLRAFLVYTIVSYFPFNLLKGVITSVVFLVLKPRLEKLSL